MTNIEAYTTLYETIRKVGEGILSRKEGRKILSQLAVQIEVANERGDTSLGKTFPIDNLVKDFDDESMNDEFFQMVMQKVLPLIRNPKQHAELLQKADANIIVARDRAKALIEAQEKLNNERKQFYADYGLYPEEVEQNV